MTYFDLGKYSRKIPTQSKDAQTWLDRGLAWLYGYNHEEAVRCFQAAAQADPDCAMAHWGVAYAIGPNYNKPWEIFEPEEKAEALRIAHEALEAGAAASTATPAEAALIEALAARYPEDSKIEDYGPWNDAFAQAMEPVYAAHPNDPDVVSVYAEAHMNRTPWQLWDLQTGKPRKGATTDKARTALENAFAALPGAWDHPGLLHMYIHLMEMSPTPEAALPHGDRLTGIVPKSGHLLHMATHIDVLCGDYQNVVSRNRAAARVDRKYVAREGSRNFYTLYRLHNLHFIAYGAMFLGQRSAALEACTALEKELPDDVVAFLPELFEAFRGMRPHVLVRFGEWQTILDHPLPKNAELYLYCTALWRYARTVALANLGRISEAEAERDLFRAAQKAVPDDRFMFNNPCPDVLRIAEAMLEGELAYKSGRIEEGLDHLRKAIELDDTLLYDEPWGWMQPTRHALGALLLDQGRFDEAEAVYRADLGLDKSLPRPCQHPRNIWSLHGLHECLSNRGEKNEIVHVRQALDQAQARAEIPVRSSCYCRMAAE